MAKKLGRREFLNRSATIGLSAVLGKTLVSGLTGGPSFAAAADKVDIAVVSGTDYGAMTAKAVELIGGIGKFIRPNSRILLIPNVQSKNPGTYTKPEIFRSVIRMCREAGAKEIACLSYLTPQHWEGAGLDKIVREENITLKLIPREDIHYRPVPIPGAGALPEARIMTEFFNYDAFINMPVTKDHAGNKFTGTLKNLMALNSPSLNRSAFHKLNWKTDPNDIAHLDACIVDLNLALQPALNIVDATEIITTNGPMGPGDLIKPMKVIAGLDRVAVDAFCAGILGLKSEEIGTIRLAYLKKIGEIDLKKLAVKEVKV
jgi:uncharacterized protein (DUF362 family)